MLIKTSAMLTDKQKKKRAAYILKTLNRLYPEVPLPLKHKDPYTLLVATILSAQCTDARVNQVTPTLFALADTPEKMAKLPLHTVEEIIKPCGLYRNKAKAIVETSRILVEKYGGQVPADLEALEQLPGVGHKTASVVAVQAFGIPAFPVDTHIHRLAKRWKLTEGKTVRQTEEDLKRLFPSEAWPKLHLQIIYYGRQYCPARGHSLDKCIICRHFEEEE